MDVLITIKAGIGPEKAQWCTRKEDNRVGTQKIIPWKAIRVTVNGRDQDTRSKRPIVADSYFLVIRDIQFTTPFLKLRRSAANFPPNFQFWVLKQYTWLPQTLFFLPPVSMNSYRRTVREPDEMWGGGGEGSWGWITSDGLASFSVLSNTPKVCHRNQDKLWCSKSPLENLRFGAFSFSFWFSVALSSWKGEQAAQAPAVRLSYCEITVMTKI